MTEKYQSELDKFDQTIQEVSDTDIDHFCRYLRSIARRDIVTVGSGGSFTAAQYLASVHESTTENLGVARTPLELLTSDPNPERCIALISASGRNKDILRAFEHAQTADVEHLLVITNNPDSPLAESANELGNALVWDLNLTVRRDGYLATNTLLGMLVTVYRGFSRAFEIAESTSLSQQRLIHPGQSRKSFLDGLRDRIEPLRNVETLLVLFGGWGKIGAVDTESRMSESGLRNVQETDVRNFAHGRHQWLVRNPDSSALVAFETPEVSPIMSKTLERLPDEIPVVKFSTDHRGAKAGLVHAIYAMYLTMELGKFSGIDPGRPTVPDWARRIHHLTPTLNQNRSSEKPESPSSINPPKTFVARLEESTFRGLVLDYDGTLVTTHGRFDPPDEDIGEELTRLVREGVELGVATGRGKSAREDLRRVLTEEIWEHVWIGYYNGTDVASLSDSDAPDGTPTVKHDQLHDCLELLQSECDGMFDLEARPNQISIVNLPRDMAVEDAWFFVSSLLSQNNKSAKVLASGHSLDVLPTCASKGSVLKKVSDAIDGAPKEILRIGDRAAWPGNDHELLSHPLGISVDRAVVNGSGGYRLTPPGIRGPAATVRLLRSIRSTDDGWTIDIEHATKPNS